MPSDDSVSEKDGVKERLGVIPNGDSKDNASHKNPSLRNRHSVCNKSVWSGVCYLSASSALCLAISTLMVSWALKNSPSS